LAASLSGCSSATSGIALWLRLSDRSAGSRAAVIDRHPRPRLTERDSASGDRRPNRGSAARREDRPGRSKYPPLCAGHRLEVDHKAGAQIRAFWAPASRWPAEIVGLVSCGSDRICAGDSGRPHLPGMNLDSGWRRPLFQLARGAGMVARAARGWENASGTGRGYQRRRACRDGIVERGEPVSVGRAWVVFAADGLGLVA